MIKIRRGCFETNSSSMDRYDDYDDGPTTTHGRQTIRIILKWADDVTEERVNEILESDFYQVEEDVFDILCSLMEDADDFEVDNFDDDDITITADVSADIHVVSPAYPGDRYSPPEPAELEFDYTGFPLKKEDCPARNKVKDDILKLFHNQGWTEIIGIENVYGEEIDDDVFYDNISY